MGMTPGGIPTAAYAALLAEAKRCKDIAEQIVAGVLASEGPEGVTRAAQPLCPQFGCFTIKALVIEIERLAGQTQRAEMAFACENGTVGFRGNIKMIEDR